MKKKLLIGYIALGLAYTVAALSSCKKSETCQKCTIYTKLTNSNTYSQEMSVNCQTNDLTGTEQQVRSKSGQIIARKTWVCDAFKVQ